MTPFGTTHFKPEHSMRERHTPRPLWISLALAAGCLLGAAGSAPAQIAESWLNYTPTEVYAGWGSTRLLGMGDMSVSVVDDRSLIDIYNYSKNSAGIVAARDTSLVDFPWSYQDFNDTYYDQSHSANQRGGAIHGEIRPNRVWAVGFDAGYGSIDASRHDGCPWPDGCRFIRDYDLMVAPVSEPVSGDQTFGAGVSSPYISGTYGRVFKKRITLGGTLGFWQEDENRRHYARYDLDLASTSTAFQVGAAYRLPALSDAVTLAGFFGYADNEVVGESESPLNRDVYNWSRPEPSFGGQVQVKSGTWLSGILDGRHSSYDGDGNAEVNWAPQFFLNPLPSDNQTVNVFHQKWLAFTSGYRRNEGSTQWLVNVPGKPVHVGVRYVYFQEYEWIVPNEEVLPTANELNVKRLGYRFGGGLSFDIPDQKGVIAAETHILHEAREDYTEQIPDLSMITYTYNFGAEYRALPYLPVRAGTVLIRHDPNRYDGYGPVKGIGLTFGTSYYWQAIQSRIDFSYGYNHFNASPNDPSDEVGSGDRFTLYIQHLF
jgi:hypothetical protein